MGVRVADDKALGAKRKSNVPAPADGASEPKRAKDETKKVTRDQLLEINAQSYHAGDLQARRASLLGAGDGRAMERSADEAVAQVTQLWDSMKAAAFESDITEDRMEHFVDAWDSVVKVQAAAKGLAARHAPAARKPPETAAGAPAVPLSLDLLRVSGGGGDRRSGRWGSFCG